MRQRPLNPTGLLARARDLDYLLIAIALFLVGLGIYTIAGATLDDPRAAVAELWKKQLVSGLAALVVAGIVVAVDYRWLLRYAYLIYILSLGLLLAVYIPELGYVSKGARSWLNLPLVHYRFQPAEAMKIALILALARQLSSAGAGDPARFGSLLSTVPALLLTALPAFLILIQPDLGSAVILPVVVLGMLYAAGCPAGRLALLSLPVLAAAPPALWRLEETLSGPACFFLFWGMLAAVIVWNLRLGSRRLEIALFSLLAVASFWIVSQHFEDAWNHLHPYQQDRILAYLHPEGNQSDQGWQVHQSKIAIGSGGVFGKGWRQGTQSQQRFMAEKHTDFIFSVLAEEQGFVGCLLLLGAFGILFLRGLLIARATKHFGGMLTAMGVVVILATYACFNLAICMGLLPVTGLPLLFISYGGSSLLTAMAAVGLLVNIRFRRHA